MTRVVWVGARTMCWDQQLLDRTLSGPAWQHEVYDSDHDGPEIGSASTNDGAVVIVPARFHTAYEVSVMISALSWVVLVLTSDEESTFEHGAVAHPNMRVWVMTPRPGLHEPGPRYLGEGCADPAAVADAGPYIEPVDERPLAVQFAGQITHERRDQMRDALLAWLHAHDDLEGAYLGTDGFTQGMDRDEYLVQMAAAKIVLAPSGPATPDSFRAYEALEAGAVPIVDGLCPGYDERGYWDLVYPEGVPFPVVYDWADELDKTVEHVLGDWRRISNRCQAWWIARKRRLLNDLVADVLEVAPTLADPRHEQITALVPTSPTRGGPAAAWDRLRSTVESIRERLPEAEIIVMCDGVRSEQEDLRDEYQQMVGRLMYACQHEWHDVLPIVFEHHAHQANMTRAALELVRTPLVLFVEHDMPLAGEIPFSDLAQMVRSGFANVVRLGQDREREQYAQLMLEQTPMHWKAPGWQHIPGARIPFVRTIQWSQRPHLASTGFYRQMIGTYYGTESRTMIEDVMHGVVQDAWHRHGVAGWEQFRLVFYAPGGDETRSRHLDGRGEHDPKYPMVYAYDGPTPQGAPAPSLSRMEQLRRGSHL
jgi:hypothetical protein